MSMLPLPVRVAPRVLRPGRRRCLQTVAWYYSPRSADDDDWNDCGRRRPRPSSLSTTTTPSPEPILRLSPETIVEPPPGNRQALEKPCTVVLMEDEDLRTYDPVADSWTVPPSSWLPTFRSKIPAQCGMSFASVSFRGQDGGGDDDDRRFIDTRSSLTISDCVNALKTSHLPKLPDAVLVTRGWFSSLCALYYLESLPLQGLVMVDPLSFHIDDADDDDDDHGHGSDVRHRRHSLPQYMLHENWSRFENCDPLLLEPNSVPMMVVSTVPEISWRRAARNVADRHSDEHGPYGIVPVVDLHRRRNERAVESWGEDRGGDQGVTEDEMAGGDAETMVRVIDQWIEARVL